MPNLRMIRPHRNTPASTVTFAARPAISSNISARSPRNATNSPSWLGLHDPG